MTGRCRASSIALAYWLFSAGIPSTSAATVGTLSLAEPLAASILGVFVLHEHLTPTALLGSLLLLCGLAAACLPVARTRSAAEPRDPQLAPALEAISTASTAGAAGAVDGTGHIGKADHGQLTS
ncbi:EamA family transporter [Streptomyces rimosus]|uniref:EamA family transporter n=1 Tax=Streptomyces rimosus TaxID=1927 RepID=UPI0005189212|nr:EamA family transporter [Streptomyces rimosus]